MTEDLMTRDGRAIADIERLRFFPATAVGGAGSYVVEEGGRRVLDFSASWGAASLGYSHPAVAEAVSKAASDMGAVSLASCAVGHAVALAEDLLAHFPDGRERRVWFGHAGSDANDAVVRLLEAASPRRGILSFVGAYHGGSAASMSVSGHSSQTHAPARPGLTRLPYPDPYRPQFGPIWSPAPWPTSTGASRASCGRTRSPPSSSSRSNRTAASSCRLPDSSRVWKNAAGRTAS